MSVGEGENKRSCSSDGGKKQKRVFSSAIVAHSVLDLCADVPACARARPCSFESGEYVRLEKGVAKESLLTLNKASYYDPSKNVRYQVIDSVSQLKSEDWNRVVGVFVSGAAWQFAEWPTTKWANPAAIFENGRSKRGEQEQGGCSG